MTFQNEHAARPEGDLARLLKTEARLDEVLRQAGEQSATLVAEARSKAAAREATLALEIETESRRLEAEIASERARREMEVADATRRGVQRFEAVTAGDVEVLAKYVVDRVIGTPP
ncbi:MAG TPA: hypothetical protein VN848_12840 [Gemmatimonadales bacterium]|nr:hypothetical protein [Gemmatimonadales bacterium]